MHKHSKTLALILALAFLLSALPGVAVAVVADSVKVLVAPSLVYERVYPFSDGLAMVREGDWEVGFKISFVNKTGQKVLSVDYPWVGDFSEGLASVGNTEGKYGFIDKTGKVVIPLEYDFVSYGGFSEGLAAVSKDGKMGYIDKTGKVVIPLEYDFYYDGGFSDGMAVVSKDGKYGFIDKTGKVVVPLEHAYAYRFTEGLGRIQDSDYKTGYIDKTGTVVVPIGQYEWTNSFSDGLAAVSKDNKIGYIDKTGKIVIPIEYTEARPFSDGLAAVWNSDNKVCFIDKTGKVVIPPGDFTSANGFSGGLAMVWNDDWKIGFINTNGRLVIPFGQYDQIQHFSDGVAWVGAGDWENGFKWGLIEAVMAADPLDSADSWAKDGIKAAIAKGFVPADIQGGYTNIITRAEFCRMAVNWVVYSTGKPIAEIVAEQGLADRMNHTFSDTTNTDILAAYRLGITSGTTAPTANSPGVFSPGGQFNRQMAATMIMNTCKVIGADVSNPPASDFTDLNTADSWAHPGINYVRANSIMSGTSTTAAVFSPTATFTRQQSIITFNNVPEDLPGTSSGQGGGSGGTSAPGGSTDPGPTDDGSDFFSAGFSYWDKNTIGNILLNFRGVKEELDWDEMTGFRLTLNGKEIPFDAEFDFEYFIHKTDVEASQYMGDSHFGLTLTEPLTEHGEYILYFTYAGAERQTGSWPVPADWDW